LLAITIILSSCSTPKAISEESAPAVVAETKVEKEEAKAAAPAKEAKAAEAPEPVFPEAEDEDYYEGYLMVYGNRLDFRATDGGATLLYPASVVSEGDVESFFAFVYGRNPKLLEGFEYSFPSEGTVSLTFPGVLDAESANEAVSIFASELSAYLKEIGVAVESEGLDMEAIRKKAERGSSASLGVSLVIPEKKAEAPAAASAEPASAESASAPLAVSGSKASSASASKASSSSSSSASSSVASASTAQAASSDGGKSSIIPTLITILAAIAVIDIIILIVLVRKRRK